MRSAYTLATFPVCKHNPTSSLIEVIVMSDPGATAISSDQPDVFKLARNKTLNCFATPGDGFTSTAEMASATSVWAPTGTTLLPAQ